MDDIRFGVSGVFIPVSKSECLVKVTRRMVLCVRVYITSAVHVVYDVLVFDSVRLLLRFM